MFPGPFPLVRSHRSTLLASLARSAALTHSLLSSWDSGIFLSSFQCPESLCIALHCFESIPALVAKKLKCDFRGVSLGDSWISPEDSVMSYAPYLYATSMIGDQGFMKINDAARKVKEVRKKKIRVPKISAP